jgi:hypothetical protein
MYIESEESSSSQSKTKPKKLSSNPHTKVRGFDVPKCLKLSIPRIGSAESLVLQPSTTCPELPRVWQRCHPEAISGAQDHFSVKGVLKISEINLLE